MEFGSEKCHAYNEKWEKANNRRNKTAKLEKNQNTRREGKLQVLGNIRSRHHQTSSNERKKK